ncbi:hypothetical protein HT031_001450 [Scenedesmus sp. PABB004]|nr:hypothetical protein HT031_001450 [Scenedesmus sp. PABB004]
MHARAARGVLSSASAAAARLNPLRLLAPVAPVTPVAPVVPTAGKEAFVVVTQRPGAPAGGACDWAGADGAGGLQAQQLRFAKHLAAASNGVAPAAARSESMAWLLFDAKRAQAALFGGEGPPPCDAASWLAAPGGRALLERLLLLGGALAELGTADGLAPLASGAGARAVASLDYARLLERFLAQHGAVLAEAFAAALPNDELQAKAVHVAACLETRCVVHALLFEKIIERAGGAPEHAGAWAAAPGWPAPPGPAAPVVSVSVTNHSSLTSSLANHSSARAAAGAASEAAAAASAAAHAPRGDGLAARVGAAFALVIFVGGRLLAVVLGVAGFARDLIMQLLLLRSLAAASRGLAAAAPPGASALAAQPAWAGARRAPAAAAAAAPPAAAAQSSWAPVVAGPPLSPAAATVAPRRGARRSQGQRPLPRALGCLGLLSAEPLASGAAVRAASTPSAAAALFEQLLAQRERRKEAGRQQQRPGHRRGAAGLGAGGGELLYQLWAPEAAREAELLGGAAA